MHSLQYYYEHSLVRHFCRRAKEKWLPYPARCDFHGVTIQMDVLPRGMQQLLLDGNYEKDELILVPDLVTASDQVMEIGAAIGLVGLYCRKIIKVRNLVSVEPNPKTIANLRRNYELNGLTPNIIEAALTQRDGPVPFHTADMFWGDSLISVTGNGNQKTITVEGQTFPSLVRRAGFEFNTLIIDIEGAEQYIAIDSIPDHVNKILVEIHPNVIGVRKAYGVLESLIRSGFVVGGRSENCWSLVRN
ncbi:MAG: FkbM family methyltransferase [Verrucomicrobiota bacterium]|jgi:FkbM family methyltransferase